MTGVSRLRSWCVAPATTSHLHSVCTTSSETMRLGRGLRCQSGPYGASLTSASSSTITSVGLNPNPGQQPNPRAYPQPAPLAQTLAPTPPLCRIYKDDFLKETDEDVGKMAAVLQAAPANMHMSIQQARRGRPPPHPLPAPSHKAVAVPDTQDARAAPRRKPPHPLPTYSSPSLTDLRMPATRSAARHALAPALALTLALTLAL